MNNLRTLIRDFKEGKMYKEAAHGGSPVGPGPEAAAVFQQRLDDFWKFNDRLLVIVFIVLIAFVIFLGVLIWKFFTQPAAVAGLVAGQAGGIYFAIAQMRKLYKESVTARLLYTMLGTATDPAERIKIIDSINSYLAQP